MSKFQQRQQAISNRTHALVIGSGIAGLLAARILLKHFQYVTVIDRDFLPEQPQPRSGVPQGVYFHGLMVPGQRILEQLFPGLSTELSDNTLLSPLLTHPTKRDYYLLLITYSLSSVRFAQI